MPKTKDVAVNERGRRIGESHPKAKLSDHDIDLIRELHEQDVVAAEQTGQARKLGYKTLAKKFDVTPGYIRKVVKCHRRAQYPERHKRVKVAEA